MSKTMVKKSKNKSYRFDALHDSLCEAFSAARQFGPPDLRELAAQFDTSKSTLLWPSNIYLAPQSGPITHVRLNARAPSSAKADVGAHEVARLRSNVETVAGQPAEQLVAAFKWWGNDDSGDVLAGPAFVNTWFERLGAGYNAFRDDCKAFFLATLPQRPTVVLDRCSSALPFACDSIDRLNKADKLLAELQRDYPDRGFEWGDGLLGDSMLSSLHGLVLANVCVKMSALTGAEVCFFLDRRDGKLSADAFTPYCETLRRTLPPADDNLLTRLFADLNRGRALVTQLEAGGPQPGLLFGAL
jgi:hypothetical protein